MTKQIATCRADTNLAAAGALMWENNCGFLPIVDEANRVLSVLTDRDICIALCTKNVRPSELTTREIAVSEIQTCTPNEDVRTVLAAMRESKIHRLPVVDDAGALLGVVSVDDVVMFAGDGRRTTEVPMDAVVQTLQAISAHHLNQPLVVMTE